MSETLIVLGIIVVDVLLIGALFWKMPDWSRPELLFAVTVPAKVAGGATARAIVARYRQRVVVGTAVLLAAGVAMVAMPGGRGLELGAAVGVPLVHVAVVLWAFLAARGETRPLAAAPTGKRQAALDAPREPMPGGWAGQAGPFLLFAAVAAGLLVAWPSIPERLITHWDGGWQPDGWSEKNPALVFGLPLIGAAMCLTMVPLAWALLNRSRRVWVSGQAGRTERERRRAVVVLLLWVEYLMVAVFAPLALFPFAQSPQAAQLLTGAILVVSVFGPIALLVAFFWRYGTVLTTRGRGAEAAAAGAPVGDRTEDRHWKLGVIYYNPDDPVLFVEKRFGVGFTFNFARPSAWWILAGVIVVPLLVVLAIVLAV